MKPQPGCPFAHCCLCTQCPRPHFSRLCLFHFGLCVQHLCSDFLHPVRRGWTLQQVANCLLRQPQSTENNRVVPAAQEPTRFPAFAVHHTQEKVVPGPDLQVSHSYYSLRGGSVPFQSHDSTSNVIHPSQEHPPHFTLYPIPGIVAELVG